MGFLDNKGLENLWGKITAKLNDKVNVEAGKGLSTNDYTTEEKEKLSSLAMPDWNAAEGEEGYIENRTHWVDREIGEIIPETSLSFIDYNGFPASFSPEPYAAYPSVDTTYKVIWRGREYECISHQGTVNGITVVALGNSAPVFAAFGSSDGMETEDPFALCFMPESAVSAFNAYIVVLSFEGYDDAQIHVFGEKLNYHKLDKNYLPIMNDFLVNGNAYAAIHSITSPCDDYQMSQGAMALGYQTKAEGSYSHAEGYETVASGWNSHAEGQKTVASGENSHAEGYGTRASSFLQHVQGRYNIVDENNEYLHIVGNGTTDNNRKNAHTLDWEGNAWFAGNVYVGGELPDVRDKLVTENTVASALIDVLNHVYSPDNPPQLSWEDIGGSELPHVSNTITEDGIDVVYSFYKISDNTEFSNIDSTIVYETTVKPQNGEISIDEYEEDIDVMANDQNTISILNGVVAVVKADGETFEIGGMTFTFPESGTYAMHRAAEGYGVSYTSRVQIGEYTITWDGVTNSTKQIPDNYIPDAIVRKNDLSWEAVGGGELPHMNLVEYNSRSMDFYKISDVLNFSLDTEINTISIETTSIDKNGIASTDINNDAELYVANNIQGTAAIINGCIGIALVQGASIDVEDLGIRAFPEAGVYFLHITEKNDNDDIDYRYISRVQYGEHILTWDGKRDNTTKIPEKYLPDVITSDSIETALGYKPVSSVDLESKADKTDVQAQIEAERIRAEGVESGLATKEYVDEAISNIEIPDTVVPVQSVNGKTGAVILSASDIGALPDTTVIPSIDGLATESYVNAKVAGLVDSAPETLNTLNELATALGDDPNFATTIATQIGNIDAKVEAKVDSVNGKTGKVQLTAEDVGALPNTIELFSGSYKDLSDKPEIPSIDGLATEKYVNDAISEIEIPDVPVQSVNGKTGKVQLTAEDVGALPNTTVIPDSLSDLSEDATHRTVTDTEKNTWNKKSNFSGKYSDLTDKPSIPTNLVNGSSNYSLRTILSASNDSSYTIGVGAFAQGSSTKASGKYSHAEGYYAKALSQASHAEGYNTEASGDYSHAEGHSTKASGRNSHAEGGYTLALGQYSHAEGAGTNQECNITGEANTLTYTCSINCTNNINNIIVYNNSSATILSVDDTGYVITVSKTLSENVISDTTDNARIYSLFASGVYSHAEGYCAKAFGESSHAEGKGTIAAGLNQHVQGRYNVEDSASKYAYIVGNGTINGRSNAHTLDWDGNAWYSGDVYVGSTSGTNRDEGSKKLATEEHVTSTLASYRPNATLLTQGTDDILIFDCN